MDRKSSPRDPLAVLRRVLGGTDWVALDTETTDLGPRAEIVEIAIVEPDGREMTTLVRPLGKVSRDAARLHGLDADALVSAPGFAEVADEIRRRLARRTVLGYNVDFDRRVLWRELSRAGKPAPRCRWLDLCDLMTEWTGRRQSLSAALAEMSVPSSEVRHRAAADARAVVALAKALTAAGTRSIS